VVVELETVMAIDVAAILGVKIAEDRPERVRMNSGSDVGNHPPAKSSNTVKALIAQSGKHSFPPISPPSRRPGGNFRQPAPGRWPIPAISARHIFFGKYVKNGGSWFDSLGHHGFISIIYFTVYQAAAEEVDKKMADREPGQRSG
jgi:hypothetical protein